MRSSGNCRCHSGHQMDFWNEGVRWSSRTIIVHTSVQYVMFTGQWAPTGQITTVQLQVCALLQVTTQQRVYLTGINRKQYTRDSEPKPCVLRTDTVPIPDEVPPCMIPTCPETSDTRLALV